MTEIDLQDLQTKKITVTIRAYSLFIVFTVIFSTALAIFKGGQLYNQAEKYVTDTRRKVDKVESEVSELKNVTAVQGQKIVNLETKNKNQ